MTAQIPTSDQAPDPQQLLEHAKRLITLGRLDDAEAAFSRLTAVPGHGAEAHYGAGFVRLRKGDVTGAESCFLSALAKDPAHANSLFQLGVIAERRGELERAQARFHQAVAANPGHQGANDKLLALADRKPAAGVATLPHGVYEFLRNDPSALSRQTIAAMDAVRLERQPRFVAYLGRQVGRLATLLAVPLGLLALDAPGRLTGLAPARLPTGDVAPLLTTALWVVVLLGLAALALTFARVRTTTVTIGRGRIQIRSGLLTRRVYSVELWRVRNVKLERSLVHRVTGDGMLSLDLRGHDRALNGPRRGREGADEIELVGIARGPQLDTLHQQLLNLVFLLRANPVVKGIIQ